MSIMVGTGRGATAGVLVKNAEALELMEKIDTLVVDKTGTLTVGKPKLIEVEAARRLRRDGGAAPRRVDRTGSEHPLAAAIVAGAEERGIAISPQSRLPVHTGKGVIGNVDDHRVALGNTALLVELGRLIRPVLKPRRTATAQGQG